VANYGVNLLSPGHRTKQGLRKTSVGRAIGIASATYDPSTQKVSLTLGTPLRTNQKFQLRVSGGTGAIADQAGNPLNSPSKGSPGGDFVYNMN
jgi:hypothetical protein